MAKMDLRDERRRWFHDMEQKLNPKEEDSLFYYHSSEDRIVLSHTMLWTMTQLLMASHLKTEKDTLKLAAFSFLAVGYAGDMPEELANELLDDMDFDRYGKVKCRAATDEDGRK